MSPCGEVADAGLLALESHSDRVPEIVYPQVRKVRILLAGLATPILPSGVAHCLNRMLEVCEHMGRVFAARG